MIYLDSTSKKLELVLAGAVAANALEVSVHYFKITPQATTTERRGGVQRATSNNTTDVTIADAPELQGIIKNIHTMFVHNKDTATATVTIKIDDGGTETILVKQAIAAGESLTYEDQRGWEILSPISPPFIDTTEIVKGSLDPTKRLRIEVDGVTAGTARVWTVADADIVVAGSAAALTAGRVVYSDTGGILNASSSLTWTGSGTLALTGAQTISTTLSVTGHTTFEGVTSTGATGSGNLVYSASPTFTGTILGAAATFSGQIKGTVGDSSPILLQPTTATQGSFFQFINTGGTLDIGIDNSAASLFGKGNYATVIYRPASTAFDISRAGTSDLSISSTGAVTIPFTLGVTGHVTVEGVTSTGATGTGKFVFDASPTFTSVPAAPTASVGTNTTQLATTAFVSAFPQPISNSLAADVDLNNTANYFLGPSTAQGTSGTWFACGTVTLMATTAGSGMYVKLWDGTTVIDSAAAVIPVTSGYIAVTLSGFLASPAGNIRISVKDISSTDGKILFNQSGNSKDSTITAFKVAN